jgi:hypothetical protein
MRAMFMAYETKNCSICYNNLYEGALAQLLFGKKKKKNSSTHDSDVKYTHNSNSDLKVCDWYINIVISRNTIDA